MDNRPIGVFDSGLGGLTAVKQLRKLLPSEDIIYFGDNGRQPYGSRSEETICRYALSDMNFLLSHNIKRVIVACGTVSAVALDLLRKTYSIPTDGVIDAAALAAVRATRNGRIGVIGTAASIRSGVYARRIAEQAPSVSVHSVPCPLLVPLVENGRWSADDIVVRTVLMEYLSPILDFGADTLILGCTHYPLLADAVRTLTEGRITLIDPGAEAAKRLAEQQMDDGSHADPHRTGTLRLFVSDTDDGFSARARSFLETDVEDFCQQVDIEQFERKCVQP